MAPVGAKVRSCWVENKERRDGANKAGHLDFPMSLLLASETKRRAHLQSESRTLNKLPPATLVGAPRDPFEPVRRRAHEEVVQQVRRKLGIERRGLLLLAASLAAVVGAS